VKGRPRVAVFIDVANVEGIDFRWLMVRAGQLGYVEEIRAYGDFRQRHLDPVAIELYALGVHMVHCPSWPVGARCEDGAAKRKRTDDRLLEMEIQELLRRRPSISVYVLASSDSDVIPTCNALRRLDKRVLLVYPSARGGLGHVLPRCEIEIEEAPVRPDHREISPPSLSPESSGLLPLVWELDRLERESQYVTFTYAVANIQDGAQGDLRDRLDILLDQGVIERYVHPHPRTGQALPAIRLDRFHPLVISAFGAETRDELPPVDQASDLLAALKEGDATDA
jgi:hypothetical protein